MIGEVLRISRIANDMTIKEVSEKANVSVSYLSDLEKQRKDNPSIEMLKKICAVYNLKLSQFYMLDDYHNALIGVREELEIYRMKSNETIPRALRLKRHLIMALSFLGKEHRRKLK